MLHTRNLVRSDWQIYLLIQNHLTELTQFWYQIRQMANRYSNRPSIGFSPFTLLAMLKLLSETFIQDILVRFPGRLIFEIADISFWREIYREILRRFPGRLIFEIADISFWREIYREILRLGNEFLYKIREFG